MWCMRGKASMPALSSLTKDQWLLQNSVLPKHPEYW